MSRYRLLGLIPLFGLLYVAARFSVGTAVLLAGYVTLVGVFVYVTRKRPGRKYEKKAPSRADADLQTWDTSP